jgi:hypothetical protein
VGPSCSFIILLTSSAVAFNILYVTVSFVIVSINRSHTILKTRLLFLQQVYLYRGRDSSVGIATGYRLDDRGVGVQVPVVSRIFSCPHRPDRLWGTPGLLSNGYWGALSQVVKRPRREGDHSQLVPRSRKCESVRPLIHTPSWRTA